MLRKSRPAIVFEVNDLYQREAGFSSPAMDVLRELGYGFYGIGVQSSGTAILIQVDDGADPRTYREPWYALNLVALYEGKP
jgi:hypothetical protein